MSAATAALAVLASQHVVHTVRAYDHDPTTPSYGLEAAAKLGMDPDRVFKTLVADVDGRHVVAVVPVSCQEIGRAHV